MNAKHFWTAGEAISQQARGKWTVPKSKAVGQYIGDIKFRFQQVKIFMRSIHLLYPICLLPNDLERDKWIRSINAIQEIMHILEKRDNFSDAEIKDCQSKIDSFANVWISLNGDAGVGNYFHYLFSGHVSFFLYRYRNLYRYSQQGWESMNGRMKQVYFRRSQRAGKGSKGSHLRPIYRLYARRLGWILGVADIVFQSEGKETRDSNESLHNSVDASDELYEYLSEIVMNRNVEVHDDENIYVDIPE